MCESNGEANANRKWIRQWEQMGLFQTETGKLKIYNYYWGRYLRIVGNNVKCDVTDPE